MPRSITAYVVFGVALVSLGGCADLRRALGFEKVPPDEFAVTSSAPLTLPPDYGLRPPHSAVSRPATPAPMQEARVAVFRVKQTPVPGPGDTPMTPGEQALLTKAGASGADPRIRQQVDAEVHSLADANDSFVDSLLFWKPPVKPTENVDAVAEEKRLREGENPGEDPSLERTGHTAIQGAS